MCDDDGTVDVYSDGETGDNKKISTITINVSVSRLISRPPVQLFHFDRSFNDFNFSMFSSSAASVAISFSFTVK